MLDMNRYLETARIRIKELVDNGHDRFVLYPFGERGWMVKSILNVEFGIKEVMIVDNLLHKEYSHIKSLKELEVIKDYIVLITSDNDTCFDEIKKHFISLLMQRIA